MDEAGGALILVICLDFSGGNSSFLQERLAKFSKAVEGYTWIADW
jgi:hypothetical protein